MNARSVRIARRASSAFRWVLPVRFGGGDLEGVPGKEIVIFIADLAPGAVGDKHYHPGPEFFYVIEGTLAHEPNGGLAHMMKTGAFGSNPNKGIHLIKNPSATERAQAIDFLVAEKGQPIVIPVK